MNLIHPSEGGLGAGSRRARVLRALGSGLADSPPDLDLPDAVLHGDMPGDDVRIHPAQRALAAVIAPELARRLEHAVRASRSGRSVVAIAGGSGSGKTGVAGLLAGRLQAAGLNPLTISGDNYVRRVPAQNDAERLRVFREAGVRQLAESGLASPEAWDDLYALQAAEADSDPERCAGRPWLRGYQIAGRAALAGYLGTSLEIDFDAISSVATRFADGVDTIWRRRTGRGTHEVRVEPVDVSGVDVLIIEWTHALNPALHGIDVGIYLASTPEQTLARRVARGRDTGADSPFVAMVLEIEQHKLVEQSAGAQIVVADPALSEEVSHA